MDDSIFYTIVVALITIGVVIAIWGWDYVNNLEANGCKSFNTIYASLNGKISSITTNQSKIKDTPNNYTYTFKDYYIKTAYNACSVGYYENDAVSTCVLKDLLKQGVRGFDFEIYSIDNEPVVATSLGNNFYVKDTFNYVKFAEVLSVFKNFAYSTSTAPNPNDPIILHLRIMSNNQKMYTRIARLFEGMNDYLLGKKYSFENSGKNLGNVPLLDLTGKIPHLWKTKLLRNMLI
jgi:hypothetical protein